MEAAGKTDRELYEASLRGNRRAFGAIVERYKSLVCAVAYSATGDLNVCEDLAQETFVAAWRQLPTLRDANKLRPWLCGIARRLALLSIRNRRRDVMAGAQSLESVPERCASTPTPREEAMIEEKQRLLWGAIEQIPDAYRIPLILYYQRGQSVERLAQILGLSRDAVKQRLVRGRHMLKSEVEKFVEQSLAQTRPSRDFTAGVLAVLPRMAGRAGAAGAAREAAQPVLRRLLTGSSIGAKTLSGAGIALALAVGFAAYQLRSDGTSNKTAPSAHNMVLAAENVATAGPAIEEAEATIVGEDRAEDSSADGAREEADVVSMPETSPKTGASSKPIEGPQGTVYGDVLMLDGSPAAGATVDAFCDANWHGPCATAKTDAAGHFEVELPPDSYCFAARLGNLTASNGFCSALIRICEGERRREELRLLPGMEVRGKVVVKDTQEPVPHALVVAGSGIRTQTSTDGTFRIQGLERCGTGIKVFKDGWYSRGRSYGTGSTDVTKAVLELEPGATVHGVVTDECGKPIEGVKVKWAVSGSIFHMAFCDTVTNAKGEYMLTGLRTEDPDLPIQAEYDGYRLRNGKTKRVCITPSQRDITLNLEMNPDPDARQDVSGGGRTRTVKGRVLNHEGRPIPGAVVASGRLRTCTGASGRYSLSDVPVPSAGDTSRQGPSIWAAAEGYAPAERLLDEFGAGDCDFRLEPGHWLEGRVVDRDGRPLPGQLVVSGQSRATTDEEGRFHLDDLPCGTAPVRVPSVGGDTRAELEVDTDGHEIIAQAHGLQVSGRVLWLEDDRPVTDFAVAVTAPRDRQPDDLRSARGFRWFTSPDGTFTYYNSGPARLLGGAARLIVKVPGYVERVIERTPIRSITDIDYDSYVIYLSKSSRARCI
ncbi:MAG TPA: sigma-70 family RNA polymerase sigma factor [Candidatus Hydrogenedentes bacterium]|nr:sigma-70 family RNA polymerase sigma factor [Candidatus Hydrogenedentota bacterium]